MSYLIFGGTGSLGKALINRLAPKNDVIVYSRDEGKHWTIKNTIPKEWEVKFVIGDIRDYDAVKKCIDTFKPQNIIIAAALKQVDTCEFHPFESVKTNILGVQNVIDAVENSLHSVANVLMVSTDKSCEPINVYGMCKSISERLVLERARLTNRMTKYVAVRYGNVLDSRGSVIPLFRYQAENKEEFTLTHEDMTRFVMTLDQSIDLILTTLQHARPGEMWIPKLKAMRIKDLAEVFSKRYNKPIKVIGIRPGEKLHESLINEAESLKTKDIGSHYIVKPSWESKIYSDSMFNYTSADDVMNIETLEKHLNDLGILDWDLSRFKGREIEEIRTMP